VYIASSDAISRCVALMFFFFQAEDGIRDRNVTGVQTCALPICVVTATDEIARREHLRLSECVGWTNDADEPVLEQGNGRHARIRSEERRVGKERKGGRCTERSRKKQERRGRETQEITKTRSTQK